MVKNFVFLLLVLGLPLVGAAWQGRNLEKIFRFPPPLEIPTDYLRFSWLAAGAIILVLIALVAAWVAAPKALLSTTSGRGVSHGGELSRKAMPFPWWGWVALVWTLSWWVVAWTRLPGFEAVQRYTFFPLWLGFIVSVNGLVHQRTQTCLMQRLPARWLLLFAASALFWWVFEWLNRFVQNWHYLGVTDFRPIGYAVHASLCFSTVLPAVAAVAEALNSSLGWARRTQAGPAWPCLERRTTAMTLLVGGSAGLLLTGAAPSYFYPALWAAPLALALGESILSGRPGLAQEVARGDWRRAATWMTAALICGFFWELWNWRSLAQWIYTVPGVDRWHVFEMPLLGYSGYLPFGLECLLVIDRLGGLGRKPISRESTESLPA